MNTMDERQLRVHVPIVGWLLIASHAIFLLVGLFVLVLLLGIGIAVGEPEATTVLTIVGVGVGLFLAVLSVPGLVAGAGLLARKPWGRSVAIIVAILNLFNFPLGTLIGAYALWVLLQERASEYFG